MPAFIKEKMADQESPCVKNKAKDLDAYARASAKALGFEMEEIEDWQCCGGV